MEKYIDEEDLLGFHVFVAELELFMGNSRDEVALSELLQKLYLSIDHTDLALVKEYQRGAEQALVSLLLRGPCSEVRELLSLCLSKLYTIGENLPIFAQVNTLQGILLSKDAFTKKLSDKVKVGLFSCLYLLCCDHGTKLVSSLPALVSVAGKHINRSSTSTLVRVCGMKLIAAAIQSLGNDVRHGMVSQMEALKIAEKYLRVVFPEEVRVCGFQIIQSVSRAGGAALWVQGGVPYEETIKLVMTGVQESSSPVIQAAASEALGELLAVLKSAVLQEAIEKESRENKKQSLMKLTNKTFSDFLTTVFVESVFLNKKTVCISIVKSWVSCMSSLSFHCIPEEQDLVKYSIEFISILSKLQLTHPELKLRGLLEISGELGSGLATGEFPLAQACILFALRTGVFRKLSESGQRKLTDQLGLLLASVLGKSVPLSVCSLEGIRVLLGFLGEVSPDTASDLGITFMEKLVSTSAAVRSQAAAALGSLVRVDPACAATMLTSAHEFLKNAIEQLTSLSAPYGAMHPLPLASTEPSTSAEEAAKRDQESSVRDSMHAVYGYATGMASLIVAASSSSLSIPSRLFQEAFDLAKGLIVHPKSKMANSWAVEMKAGYCILGALSVAALPRQLSEQRKENQFLELWEPALGATAQAILLNKSLLKTGKELDLALQLWWRSEALLALEAYIKASSVLPIDKIEQILALICPILEGLISSFDLGDPQQIPGGPTGWIASTLAYLQLQLLKIFLLIPDPTLYSQQYPSLLKLCSQPLSSGFVYTPSVSSGLSSVVLRGVLESADHGLGPWEMEEEPMEEKLNSMTGEKGAPHYAGWECGMFVWGIENTAITQSSPPIRLQYEPTPFPQYTSLSISLIQTQLLLYGKILNQLPVQGKLQLLDSLLDAVRKARTGRNQQNQEALLSAVCCVVLSSPETRPKTGSSVEVAQKTVELSMAILENGIKNFGLIRAAAEILSLAGCLGGDSFSLKLIKKLTADLSSSPSLQQCFLLLSIGGLFRSKGGMCLQTTLPELTTVLFSLIQRPTGEVLYWILHCLSLTSISAGLTFMSYVKTTLGLMERLMMSDLDTRRLKPFIGRLTNAMVVLLGPELYPGSQNYITCKSLMRQMRAMKTDQTPLGDAGVIPGSLEQVLYAQQLILFAPQAVPAQKHVGMLMKALFSSLPSLRYNAVITLRHLTERDPQAICQEAIEKELFQALDKESEIHISRALHLTLETLQLAQCPQKPSIWLDVCASIVLISPRETRSEGRGSRRVGSLMEELEEGVMESSGGKPQDQLCTPRLKTRLFACHCLLRIFQSVGEDKRHFDLIKARLNSDSEQEFLVCFLDEIVRLGFSLATGPVEALQPEGIKLLDAVILHFGQAEDPDVDQTKLLFQFQAQFISPLRQALSPAAPPLLFMAGSTLAVSFLRSGLGGSDAIVLKQLVALLVEPILNWNQLQYRNFSEWVSSSVRVSFLEAHAHCTVLATHKEDPLCSEIVHNAQKPVLESLRGLWMALLTDLMVLTKPRLWNSYQPSVICFDPERSLEVEDTWLIILKALVLHLPSARDIIPGTEPRPSESNSSSPRMDRIKNFKPISEDLLDFNLADFYWRVLDITTVHLGSSSMKLIEQAKTEDGLQDAHYINIQPLCVCLSVLQNLFAEDYTSMSLCPADIFLEVLEMILSILQQVIHPIICSLLTHQKHDLHKLVCIVLSTTQVLLEMSKALKNNDLHQENFISVFLDCFLGCSSLLTPTNEDPNTIPSNALEVNKGVENCLAGLKFMLQFSPWELMKEGIGTVLQHALVLMKTNELEEEVVACASDVIVEAVGKLQHQPVNADCTQEEFTSSSELPLWISWQILDLTKTLISAFQSPENYERLEKTSIKLAKLVGLTLKLETQLSSEISDSSSAFQSELFRVLSNGLELNQRDELQLSILKALKTFLQDSVHETSSESIHFTSLCVVEMSPIVASLAHEKIHLLSQNSRDLQVVVEALKCLIVALSLPCVKGKEHLIFQVLIPLLMEAMECSNSKDIQQMAMKLITHLNSTQPTFKTTIGELPPDLKQRFQKGMQQMMGIQETKSESTRFVSNTSTDQKPTIVLKNFALR